jgi:Lactate racemase N-terminal domain
VTRVPLLAGSRVAIVTTGDDDVVLAPPPPRAPVADVGAAVRDALRFPLAGEPLEALVTRGGRTTIVVEPPALPVPSTPVDPRPAALEATVDELERAGVASERMTILVAGRLARRAGRSELELLVPPPLARRFRGTVEVHDAEAPDLVPIPANARHEVRVHRALVDTDLVVGVSAAETVLHGGAGALVGAADAQTLRAADAYSLLETTASQGWQTALAIERALSSRAPLIASSLVLTLPRLTGMLQGYPYEEESLDRVVRSPLRHLFSLLPADIRDRALRAVPAARGVSTVFAGPPSVAHAEALLRGTEERARSLGEPLDAIVLGVPATTPHLPRERPDPLLAAYLGLGLALRLWRDAFPVVDGGTAILLHPFDRRFTRPTQQPYREFFRAIRGGTARDAGLLRDAEEAAAHDARLLDAYRQGRAHHPLQPYAEWSACGPALGRLGAVLVAGCRDHDGARSLGFVPTHGAGAALQMARARTDGAARIGFVLAPPYFPLRVRA